MISTIISVTCFLMVALVAAIYALDFLKERTELLFTPFLSTAIFMWVGLLTSNSWFPIELNIWSALLIVAAGPMVALMLFMIIFGLFRRLFS